MSAAVSAAAMADSPVDSDWTPTWTHDLLSRRKPRIPGMWGDLLSRPSLLGQAPLGAPGRAALHAVGLPLLGDATRVRGLPPAIPKPRVPRMSLLRRVFYGWYVVGAVLVITTAISGFFFYNLSILLAAFVAERGFPVGLASSATATFFIAAGIGGLAAGRLVDRFDVRFFVIGGTLLGTLALASVGTLSATWQLYAFHVVLGADRKSVVEGQGGV